jgi:AcrR family transcriptional regulator
MIESSQPRVERPERASGSGSGAPAALGRASTRAALPARDEQARERRRQLVGLASGLIEREGIAAVTLPRVTELAGCARTLAYRYFASREELLLAVLHDYFDRLDAQMSEADQRSAVAALIGASTRGEPRAAHELVALFWDVQAAAGLGGAILRATPTSTAQMRSLADELRDRHERRFIDPLRDAGLSEHEARIALDSMIASFVGLSLRARAGEIGREEAIDIHSRATVGVIRGLLPVDRRPGPGPRRKAA